MPSPPTPSLFLIGYRGTGKSTVGRLLADRLGRPLVDSDALIEAAAGCSIAELFARAGEAAFRDLEEAVLADVCRQPGRVVATGGGVVLREANRRRLREAGLVAWLTADAETIAERLAGDPSTADRRPALTSGGRAEVEALLRQREPLYRECAGVTVATAGQSPEAVAAAILGEWTNYCSGCR
jgi:shikimate kinase